jgi:spore coat polysaccharide biosynthesis protein SpsF (cytidylyltransferase family)
VDAAIILQARMGSTRLPGKALADIGGRPLVQHCIERLRATSTLPVVLATTEKPEDDCLEALGNRLGVIVFRGADGDVLSRYAMAAARFALRYVIRATGDNPAVDMDAPWRTLHLLRRTGADYVVEHGLPYGSAVEAMTAEALARAADLAHEPPDREHVTPLLRRDGRFRALAAIAPGRLRRPQLRFTVDTSEDLQYVRKLFALVDRGDGRPLPLVELIEAADLMGDGRTSHSEAWGA